VYALLGVLMERSEAVEILEEIVESCNGIDGKYLALMPPDPSSKLSMGYQVHFKMNLSGQDRKCFEDLLNEHGLAWHESEGETVIYRRAS
jgi:hypothetical protein